MSDRYDLRIMNLSAILVVVPQQYLSATVERLEALPGISVHHTDEATGRMIVIQEAETIESEMDGLRRIQELPRIILAELVQHHFEDDPQITEAAFNQEIPPPVPKRLED